MKFGAVGLLQGFGKGEKHSGALPLFELAPFPLMFLSSARHDASQHGFAREREAVHCAQCLIAIRRRGAPLAKTSLIFPAAPSMRPRPMSRTVSRGILA
jgi:hypothetical protein